MMAGSHPSSKKWSIDIITKPAASSDPNYRTSNILLMVFSAGLVFAASDILSAEYRKHMTTDPMTIRQTFKNPTKFTQGT